MSPERTESFRRLAWTMAGLVAALGPHLLRMQAWVSAFVIGACAWRLLAERRGWRLPPALLRGLIAAGVTVGVVIGYSTITGLDGGTALLALMSALKLLETKTARDHAVLIFIGWFLCLAAFLYAQDVATAAWVLPTVWLLAAALLRVSRRGTDDPCAAAFPHDGRHAAEGGPGRARPVLLLSAGRGQLLGRSVLRARADRTLGRDVARRHFRPDPERRRRLPRALPGQPAAAAATLLARPRLLAVRRLHLVAGRRAVLLPPGGRARGRARRLHDHARAHRAAHAVCARHGRELDAGPRRPGLGLRAAHAPPGQCGAAVRRALLSEVPCGRRARARAQEREPAAPAQPQPALGRVRAEPA